MSDVKKFHHDNMQSALDFYARNDFVDPQVKFLKDGIVHYGPVDDEGQGDPPRWIHSVAEREQAEAVTFVGLARLESVNGVECLDCGPDGKPKMVLVGYTWSPGNRMIVNMFEMKREGDKLEFVAPKEIAQLEGKDARAILTALKPRKGMVSAR